ncbi:MAG: protein TolQ [Holosporaceae bacterium]|jgi:biopolymer transport protein TolQ|nr:protein TolQ [Holosporaceae bacterium]
MSDQLASIVTLTNAAASDVHNFSLLSLFSQASLTVKIVIVLLIGCSFWSWTIIFAKTSLIRRLKATANKFEDAFWNCGSIEMFFDNIVNRGEDPFVNVFISGMNEWHRAKNKKTPLNAIAIRERIETMMRVTIGREIDFLERHIGFLATVGSTAPFVGLFGTVWGIMNSFESIGLDQNTSLTAVAPGIAEALFATALGLVVTIPAVIAYNKISGEINRYQNRLDAFVDEFSTIISRQMEEEQG